MEIKRSVTNKRAISVLLIVIILFIILLGRIVYIQTTKEINGNNLKAMAKERWTHSQEIKSIRGTIYDRFGSELAQEITSYTVFAVLDKSQKSHVKDPKNTAKILSPYISMPEKKLEQLLKRDKFQVELGIGARNLTFEKMKEVEHLELEGIYFREEPRRYYPKQTYASHVIGYIERNMLTPGLGLERSLDDQLQGENGLIKYQTERSGIPLPNPNQHLIPAKNGNNVYLTLLNFRRVKSANKP
jgi:penicillin-binding protein 2B